MLTVLRCLWVYMPRMMKYIPFHVVVDFVQPLFDMRGVSRDKKPHLTLPQDTLVYHSFN
jgi:hypothetical protein